MRPDMTLSPNESVVRRTWKPSIYTANAIPMVSYLKMRNEMCLLPTKREYKCKKWSITYNFYINGMKMLSIDVYKFWVFTKFWAKYWDVSAIYDSDDIRYLVLLSEPLRNNFTALVIKKWKVKSSFGWNYFTYHLAISFISSWVGNLMYLRHRTRLIMSIISCKILLTVLCATATLVSFPTPSW